MTGNGPAFDKKPSYVSDVRFSRALSRDNKSTAILFDDFFVSILPGGPPVASRSLSIGFPLVETVSEAELAIDVRGAAFFEGSTNGTCVFRLLGTTHVLDPLVGQDDETTGNFVKSLRVRVPVGSEDLRMTLVVLVEQARTSSPDRRL
jgi:hypothetical protein